MDNKTKERVGPLTRKQCELMKNYLVHEYLPSYEEIRDAGFPFFETSLSDKLSYSRQRFRAWAVKLNIAHDGTLVFGSTGKELLVKEDIERVVMEIHCNKSQKHRKLNSVFWKLKEKYSIKRRAFGPSEDAIRAIVQSCPNPQCQFVQVAHYKQQYDDSTKAQQSQTLPVSSHSNNLCDLSPRKIQGQLDIVGIGTVSPTSGDERRTKSGDHATGDCIRANIQQQQNRNLQRTSGSSYSPNIQEKLFVSRPNVPDEIDSTRTKPFGIDRLVKTTLVDKLSPNKNEQNQSKQTNGNYFGGGQLGTTENSSPNMNGGVAGSTSQPSTLRNLMCKSTPIQPSVEIGSRMIVGVSTGLPHVTHDTVLPGYKQNTPGKPLNVSNIPGVPSMSSKVFDDQQNKHTPPVRSQANKSIRTILPKELPHIYPVTSDKVNGQQYGQLGHNAESRYPVNYDSLDRNCSRKTKRHSSTAEDFTQIGPTKMQKCDDLCQREKTSAATVKGMVTGIKKTKRKGKRSKSNDRLGNDLLHTDNETSGKNEQMEKMWQELRKNKGKRELEVIDKSEKNISGKIQEKLRGELDENDQRISNTTFSLLNSEHLGTSGSAQCIDSFQNMAPKSKVLNIVPNFGKHYHCTPGNAYDNNNMWTVHPDQRYARHVMGKSRWHEGIDERSAAWEPKPPPAHRKSPNSEFFIGARKALNNCKNQVCNESDEPLDLSVKFDKAAHIPFKDKVHNPNEALDLSMKKQDCEIKPLQVPVASIKPMVPVSPESKKETMRQNSGTYSRDGHVTQVTGNQGTAGRQRERRIQIMETSASPTSTDDDVSEVASVHVSLYVKTPQKIARAEVVTIPRMSPGAQNPVISQEQHLNNFNERHSFSQRRRMSSVVTLETKRASTATPSFNPNRRPSTSPDRTKKKRRKRSLTQERMDFDVTQNRQPVYSKATNSEEVRAGVPMCLPQLIRKPYNAFVDKGEELTPENVKANLFGSKRELVPAVETQSSNKDLCVNLTSAPGVSVHKGDQTPSEIAASDFNLFDVQGREEAPSQTANQESQPVCEASVPERATVLQAGKATKSRRSRKKKDQTEKSTNKCAELKYMKNDVNPQNDNLVVETSPKTGGTFGFSPEKFLALKQIEAYGIQMKEAERRKEMILGDIAEQTSTMREMYRACMSDLGKNNLDKIKYAIQDLLDSIHDCRNALLREEAAATCMEVLKGVER